MSRVFVRAAAALISACLSAGTGATESPELDSVWIEQVIGHPEQPGSQTGRMMRPITGDKAFYEFQNGEYKSVLSRIRLKLPRIGTESHVTVREGVPFRRADGQIATAHLVIVPGKFAPAPGADGQAMSAVVVTRLRDDRPKDRDSVLRQWEPSSDAARDEQQRAGVSTERIMLRRWGQAVQRVVTNRASIEPFPYRMNVLRSRTVETVGVSRFVVVGEDSLIEFAQIVPCGARAAADCRTEALMSADRFVDGVVEFLILPAEKKE